MRALEGQTALDLFPAKRTTDADFMEECIAWMRKCYRCGDSEVRPTVEAVYAAFKPWEAFDRCKAIVPKAPGWSMDEMRDVYGLLDAGLDYHTCWDRAWAARKGYAKDDVMRLEGWDYLRDEPVWREG